MNDFTKKELEYLEELTSEYYEYFEGEEDEVWNLHDKLKSMIENYCEHEPEGHYHVAVDKCKKCGDFYR